MRYISGLIIASILATTPAIAGNEGAGGDVAFIDEKPYLLDLVENGFHRDTHFDESYRTHRKFPVLAEMFKNHLGALGNDEVAELLALKILEVADIDMGPAFAMWSSLMQHRWRMVEHVLVDIPDEDSIFNPSLPLSQVAIRRHQNIFVSEKVWPQMDANNQAALIFHEVVFSIIKPRALTVTIDGKQFLAWRQDSTKVREVIGVLFGDFGTRERGQRFDLLIRAFDDEFFDVPRTFVQNHQFHASFYEFASTAFYYGLYVHGSKYDRNGGGAIVVYPYEAATACDPLKVPGTSFIKLGTKYSSAAMEFASLTSVNGKTFTYLKHRRGTWPSDQKEFRDYNECVRHVNYWISSSPIITTDHPFKP